MNFEHLTSSILQIHHELQNNSIKTINKFLTFRNWLIGYYIVEYEQNGEDKAKYGDKLLKNLEAKLHDIKGMSESQLYLFKNFYLTYPQIFLTLSGIFKLLPETLGKINIPSRLKEKENSIEVPPDKLIDRLSFSHFIELIKCDSELKRTFYEVQVIKNNWSVRELKRAVNSMLFERVGLSENKESIILKANDQIPLLPLDSIKNPYLLEFLGLKEKSEYSENDLEQAIINHLQDFLMEMGRGFCFEARQKRITFDNHHYYIDLLFYHRILKCHVIIDLKLGEFSHADAGQMNVYLNYFKENEITSGDNPPIGIILCADKNNSLVKYATGGLPHEIFVSKYLIELPSQEKLEVFIKQELQGL
jgi:predicted nuclease of restriction endonuclease-like (RecB) superfamily